MRELLLTIAVAAAASGAEAQDVEAEFEYPFTLTASGEGMMYATYGILEQPEGPLTILMTRETSDDRKDLSASSH